MSTSRKGIGGPKTEEGKRRVSLNALKHGLNAQSPQAMEAINETIGVSYEEVLAEMQEHYQPKDVIEKMLVQRIARLWWRMLLIQHMEQQKLIRFCEYISKSYEKILKTERIIDLQFHKAIASLDRKRAAERAQKEKQQNKLRKELEEIRYKDVPSVRKHYPQREFVPVKASIPAIEKRVVGRIVGGASERRVIWHWCCG